MIYDDEKSTKIALFHIVYTSIYFPTLFSLMVWINGVDYIGKYSFQPILLMIAVAEYAKYFASSLQLMRYEYNLSKKVDCSIFNALSRLLTNRMKVKEGFKTLIAITLTTVLFFIISILFGAEVFHKHEETLMFSTLLSVLTILPACFNQGAQFIMPMLLGYNPTNSLEVLLNQNLQLTLLGAWLGAIAIPLDWDRHWQVWPIPCSLGAMTGFFISHLIMAYRLRSNMGKKSVL